ncbi:CCAAT/enhancer-binding protein zeta [Diprion similis]|uniref:CCAAT/enhancer-binding protein zeta n=1 Tax=Diprion similis TaxID=362088 RepID=UPI001EF894ED|nr:CCAAT/enhancer-binding protein zeta [Diprion similis]
MSKSNHNVRDLNKAKFDKWYEEFPKTHDIIASGKTELEIIELKDEAKKCLDADTAAFNLKQSKLGKSDFSWMKTFLSKGTVADKVAASVILIQDNPKYNLSRLSNLVSMVKVSKKKQCTMIIDTLQELFSSDLLHPDYKLFTFEQQNFILLSDKLFANNPIKRRQLLAHWYFEDQLKMCYSQFIDALNTVAHDTLDANKEKAITNMYKLLAKNAEQEEKLLAHIVNKIGDPSAKVASKAVFCLGQLLDEHPNMKQVVLNEVEKLLFRKNVTPKAQYYAICLLTQFVLDDESKEVANNLISLYFSFFKACLKKGEVDSRMMGALLMGVNRAFPFSEMDPTKLEEHIDTIYKVVHIGSFNVSVNALSLLHQIVGKEDKQSNRFYCAMYKKLMDPHIGTTTHQAMFLSLLFKVLKKDTSIIRTKAFIKRILQVSIYLPTNMICAILYMISQVFKAKKGVYIGMFKKNHDAATSRNTNTEIVLDDTEEGILKKDEAEDQEEGEEDEEEEESEEKEEEKTTITLSNVKVTPIENLLETVEPKIEVKEENVKAYNPFHRNPLYSGANLSYYHELWPLTFHFHPTVTLFANTIIKGKPIVYTGDPLQDFTLIRFLDRYVFKNPKKLEENKILINQKNPLAKRSSYMAKGVKSMPVNSKTYLNEDENKIPADELFLYNYLKSQNLITKDDNEDDDEDDDLESVNSEEFNTMLDGLGKDKDFDDIDIAGEISASKKKRKKGEEESENESSDDSDVDEDSDESIDQDDNGSEEEILSDMEQDDEDDLEGIDDEDLSDMDFGDDDDDEDQSDESSPHKTSKGKMRKKSNYDQNVFAAAEEFAELLDQEGTSKSKHGGANTLSSVDKAAVKQLDWEEKRHRWIKGYNKSIGKSKPRTGSQKKGVKRFKKR